MTTGADVIELVEATEGLLALGLVCVTLLVLRARRRRRLPALAWLAASFASLAVGAAFGRHLAAPSQTGPLEEVALRLGRMVASFPGSFTVRFIHQIEPAPRWLLRLTLLGASLPAPPPPEGHGPRASPWC